ncbi:rhodanese-like domain-containing protein [Actomonas aquatica]|uniref:Rhodanese-like domain-containing protein n=1 Tax=Actomonas aquatica TaxID=2866162 RepID=A0ABZ1CDR9_9BACT|nr:rhodanese-like domain-containing protein [Opitutus sp. WL0086]WRQ89833.1 rhodanese-like domain-containing protein [Opitutus sp. WL0086]
MIRRALPEALGLLLLALPPAALSYFVHPDAALHRDANEPLPEYHLTLAQAEALVADATTPPLWIDARPPSAYSAGHYAGAINLPPAEWDRHFPQLLPHWAPDRIIIVYCSSTSCDASDQVARRLRRELGQQEKIWVLHSGWSALQDTVKP